MFSQCVYRVISLGQTIQPTIKPLNMIKAPFKGTTKDVVDRGYDDGQLDVLENDCVEDSDRFLLRGNGGFLVK